jgi:hypothetical protein
MPVTTSYIREDEHRARRVRQTRVTLDCGPVAGPSTPLGMFSPNEGGEREKGTGPFFAGAVLRVLRTKGSRPPLPSRIL